MRSGDVLYFWGEDTALMVVMANDKGVRIYDTSNPEFTEEGNLITRFVSYEESDEVCSYMGNVEEMVRFKVTQFQVEDADLFDIGY